MSEINKIPIRPDSADTDVTAGADAPRVSVSPTVNNGHVLPPTPGVMFGSELDESGKGDTVADENELYPRPTTSYPTGSDNLIRKYLRRGKWITAMATLVLLLAAGTFLYQVLTGGSGQSVTPQEGNNIVNNQVDNSVSMNYKLKVNGQLEVKEQALLNTLKVTGASVFDGLITAKAIESTEVSVNGQVVVTGDLQATNLLGNGSGLSNVDALTFDGLPVSYFLSLIEDAAASPPANEDAALRSAENNFSAVNTFGANTIFSNGMTVQGNLSGNSAVFSTSISALQFTQDGNVVCDMSGNCAGSGMGVTTSGGTIGAIAMFTGSQVLGNSLLSQNGSTILVGGNLTVSGAGNVAFLKGNDYSTSGFLNDVNFGNGSVFRLTGTSQQRINGIAGGTDGRMITLINDSTSWVSIRHDNSGSAFGNRIHTGSYIDTFIPLGTAMTLIYDSTASMWRIVGSSVNSSLTNLNNVAVNVAFNPDSDNVRDIGSSAASWRTVYADTSVLTPTLDTATADSLGIGDTTANAVSISRTGIATTVNGGLIVTQAGSFNGGLSVNSNLTVSGAGNVAYQKGNDFTGTGTQNDVNFGPGTLIRLTGATGPSITGIAGGTDGKIITIVNATGTGWVNIAEESASSSPANRIITGTFATAYINPGGSVTLIYDSGANRWRLIGSASANTRLTNLSNTAVNVSLLANADNVIDLGSSAFSWRTLYADTSVLSPTVDTAGAYTLNVGTTNATTVSIARTGVSTNINGLLQVTQAATFNGGVSVASNLMVTGAGNVAFQRSADFSATGTQNDVNFGAGSLFRITSNSTTTITGIAGGSDGRIITLANASTGWVTLTNDDVNSNAANRIITGTNNYIWLIDGASIQLIYDSGASRWRVVGATASAGVMGGSANQQLSNLIGTVAANLSISPGADNTLDLGSSATSWRTLYADTSILSPTVDTASSSTLNLGATTANAISISRSGVTTTVNGALTVAQATNLNGATTTTASSGIALTVQGANGQDITVFKNSSGTTMAAFNQYGDFVGGAGLHMTSSSSDGVRTLQATTTNSNTSATTANHYGLRIILAGSANTLGINNTYGTYYNTVTPATGNTFTGMYFGTGYDSLLNYNGTMLITGQGKLLNAGLSSAVNYSNLQNVTNLTAAGTLDVTSLATISGGLTVTNGGNVAYQRNTADIITNGVLNDLNIGSGALFRFTGTAGQVLNGIAGGTDGRIITLVNNGTNWLSIVNNSGGSLAANRILTGGGGTINIQQNASVSLVYDSASSVWRVIGSNTGANQQLSNLNGAGTSINASLTPNTDNALDLGSSANSWRTLYSDTSVLTPTVDTASAATLNLGTATATAISISRTGVTTTINGGLTVTSGGNVAFQKGTDYSTNGTSHNVDFGTGALFRLTGTSAQVITGIADGADGRIITIVNSGTNWASLTHQNTGSLAANRIITDGSSVNITVGSSVSLVYDSTASRWRVIGTSTGANQSLSNLSGTFINATLQADGDNTRDLGTSSFSWRTLYADTSVLSPSVDTASATTLNLGNVTANAVSVARTGVTTTVNGALSVAQAATITGQLSLPTPGSSAGIVLGGDTNLYRAAADILRTEDRFSVLRANTSDIAYTMSVVGDSVARLAVGADGQMSWGPGNAAADTTLYRYAANVLQTDDGLNVGAGLAVTGATALSGSISVSTVSGVALAVQGVSGQSMATFSNSGGIVAYIDDMGGFHTNLYAGGESVSSSGDVTFRSGISLAGNSGNVNLDSGTAAGTTGVISIGATNASGVILARSGITTTISGTLTVAQAATFNNTLTVNGHIITGNTSGTTTIAAGAAGNCAGSASVSVTGNDTSGNVTITTGTGACAAGTMATVTFANAYGAAPNVVMTPRNAASAGLQYYYTSATGNFTIDSNTAATASTTYTYSYHVMQ